MVAKRRKSSKDQSKSKQGRPEAIPPLPDRRVMEKMLREMAGNLGGDRDPDSPLDRAQELVGQAFEAKGASRSVWPARRLKCLPTVPMLMSFWPSTPITPKTRRDYARAGAGGGPACDWGRGIQGV